MTTLLLLRHGETEANRGRRIQGQDDTPLTATGIATITRVADKLRDQGLDPEGLIRYCSPLPRARDTLQRLHDALSWQGHPITYDERLQEIHFGDYTGRPVEEILPLIQHHKENSALAYPGGESGDDLKARVMGFLGDVLGRHPEGNILVMTHFGPIETALRHYLGIPVSERVWPAHDQVHRLVFSGTGTAPRVTTL